MTVRETGRRPVGELLREWRERRRFSQLDLAIQAEISAPAPAPRSGPWPTPG